MPAPSQIARRQSSLPAFRDLWPHCLDFRTFSHFWRSTGTDKGAETGAATGETFQLCGSYLVVFLRRYEPSYFIHFVRHHSFTTGNILPFLKISPLDRPYLTDFHSSFKLIVSLCGCISLPNKVTLTDSGNCVIWPAIKQQPVARLAIESNESLSR